MNFFSFLSKILDYIYYRKCYICAKKCSDISLCTDCLNSLYSELKFKETKKFNTNIYCAAAYENTLLKIIRALKYHRKREFKSILSGILIKTVQYYNLNLEGYVVCPVPIHKNRFNKRKYNHMELVAEEFAKHFSLKTDFSLLSRIKDTPPMYKLSVSQRKEYLVDAFSANGNINGQKILLIDDIITSGATINELSKLIFEQKPKNLLVMCVSYSNNCNF